MKIKTHGNLRRVRACRAGTALLAGAVMLVATGCGRPAADVPSQAPGAPLSVTYEGYGGPTNAVQRVSENLFVKGHWENWFHIVVGTEAGVGGPSLGAWDRQRDGSRMVGFIAGRDNRPHKPGEAGLLTAAEMAPQSYREGSVDVMSEDLRRVQNRDPETGKVTPRDYDGRAPNQFMNLRFVWDQSLPSGYQAATKVEVPVLLAVDGDNDFVRALKADDIAAAVGDMLGIPSAQGGIAKPSACLTCDSLVAVWDPDTRLPLLAAEVSPLGEIVGLLVREIGPASDENRRYLA